MTCATAKRNDFVMANRSLAYFAIAKVIRSSSLLRRLGTQRDIEQEALLVLVRTADSFNPEFGVKFSSYAVKAVFRSLYERACASGLIKVPRQKHWQPLRRDEGRRRALFHVRQLRRVLPDKKGMEFSEEQERKEDIRDRVMAAIAQLPERLQQVIKMRFGIGCEEMGLLEVGRRLGVSKERARQLEVNALKKLRPLLV